MSVQIQAHETDRPDLQRFETIVIGGGQAGLSMGYHLARRGHPFVILDGGERVGDSWRRHYDSLRLFTPARRNGLPGLRFPAPTHAFPTGREMADYLEGYAARFELPVLSGVHVDALSRSPDRSFLIAAGDRRFEADNVVIATGPFQAPRIPGFAEELDPRIMQLHSSRYRNPAQMPDGDVLVIGAGTSGADVALELASERHVWLSGDLPGEIPIDIDGVAARLAFPLLWQLWTHVLTWSTPIGRKALPKLAAGKQPLFRVKAQHLRAAGVEFVPRTTGTDGGLPELLDGRTLDPAAVVWCTGYRPEYRWVDLPVLDASGDIETDHDGASTTEPGLYRLGREFLHAFNSHTVGGVGRDAERIAKRIASERRDA